MQPHLNHPLSRYRGTDDLPQVIPVFPLSGTLLLPRGQLPLNIFEPRYLQMVDDALSSDRIIGMIQPQGDGSDQGSLSAPPGLFEVGCAGRITSFSELDDGRVLISLTGICRFCVAEELNVLTPYRQVRAAWDAFETDLEPGRGEDEVDRTKLLQILKTYLDAHGLQADWKAIESSGNEQLVNSLSIISPYGPREKQALLEAESLEKRNEILIALTEMVLAQGSENDASVQ